MPPEIDESSAEQQQPDNLLSTFAPNYPYSLSPPLTHAPYAMVTQSPTTLLTSSSLSNQYGGSPNTIHPQDFGSAYTPIISSPQSSQSLSQDLDIMGVPPTTTSGCSSSQGRYYGNPLQLEDGSEAISELGTSSHTIILSADNALRELLPVVPKRRSVHLKDGSGLRMINKEKKAQIAVTSLQKTADMLCLSHEFLNYKLKYPLDYRFRSVETSAGKFDVRIMTGNEKASTKIWEEWVPYIPWKGDVFENGEESHKHSSVAGMELNPVSRVYTPIGGSRGRGKKNRTLHLNVDPSKCWMTTTGSAAGLKAKLDRQGVTKATMRGLFKKASESPTGWATIVGIYWTRWLTDGEDALNEGTGWVPYVPWPGDTPIPKSSLFLKAVCTLPF